MHFEIRPGVRRLLRFPLRSRAAVERELDDELDLLVANRIEHLIGRGMSAEEARAEALRRVGAPLDQVCHQLHSTAQHRGRRMRFRELFDGIVQDLRHACRSLRKSPGFAVAAVLSLALGIGACTTIYSAVDAVLLRSLPFRELERLVAIKAVSKRCPDCDNATPGHYLAIGAQARSFASLAAYGAWSGALQGRERTERLEGVVVTPHFFSTLGVAPAIGRTFEADSASPLLAHEVVVSDAFWRKTLDSDPSAVGSTITISGEAYTVIGVMPATFAFPAATQVWLPLTLNGAAANDLSTHWLHIVGRLVPGATMERAQRELAVVTKRLQAAHADQAREWRLTSQSLSDAMLHQMWQFFSLLIATAIFVLLIVCANVANLLIARHSAREREVAVRTALGAGRWRIAQQLIAESLVLAVLGAASGGMLAAWSVRLLKGAIPASMMRFVLGWDALAMNGRAVVFAVVVSLISALIAGVMPALRGSRPEMTSLREGGGSSAGSRGTRLRRMLVAGEFALALVLLVSAGLMVQSVRNLLATSTGMQTRDVLTMSLELPWTRNAGLAQAAPLYLRLQSAVAAVPGVQSTAVITTLPLNHERQFTRFNIVGKPIVPVAQAPTAVSECVTPGYFETLGIPLVSGRDFAVHDDAGAPPVAIVSETMARRYWPDGNAVGRELDLYGTRHRIVGVAGDVRDQMEYAPAATIYQPALQISSRNVALVVRSACSHQSAACDAESLAPTITRAIASMSPAVAVSNVRAMPRVVNEYIAPWRLLMSLTCIFATAALITAAVGIYGVTMSSVVQRTHEIGVRMALGADRREVLRMIVRDAARFVGWGSVFGILGALAVTRVLPFLLYGVSATDPAVIGTIAVLLASVALVASWLPARRAASVDPMTALRRD